jgi:hypothetical protein
MRLKFLGLHDEEEYDKRGDVVSSYSADNDLLGHGNLAVPVETVVGH